MNNQYLNEEKYKKINSKISLISKIILVVGFAIGITLISIGVVIKSNVNNENRKIESEIKEDAKKSLEKDNNSIKELEKEIELLKEKKSSLEDEVEKLQDDKSIAFEKERGFGNDYKRIDKEINKKQNEIFNLKQQINEKDREKFRLNANLSSYDEGSINSKYYSKKKIEPVTVYACFGLGGMAIFMGIAFSLSALLISKRREILAYQTQQMMPIAKEGIKEMGPTMGQVAGEMMKDVAPAYKEMTKTIVPIYGEIAREVGKGVSEGIKESNREEK